MVDLIILGACLCVLAWSQWYLMRHEAARRANRRTRILVNGREFWTITEAEAAADWLESCGITPVVEWPEVEAVDEPGEAVKAGGEYGV